MGPSVDDFYDYLKTTSDAGRKLPNWCVTVVDYEIDGLILGRTAKAWGALP